MDSLVCESSALLIDRVVLRSYSSCGISQSDFSYTPERDKWCIDARQLHRLFSCPDEGQRYHSYTYHRTQGQAPGRGTPDSKQSFTDFDNSDERWKEKKEVFWLRPSYISVPMLYTCTVHALHISSFSPMLVVVVCLRCFHLAKLNSVVYLSSPQSSRSWIYLLIKEQTSVDCYS